MSALSRLFAVALLSVPALAACVGEPATSSDLTTLDHPSRSALPALSALTHGEDTTSVETAGRRPPRPTDPLFAAVLGRWAGECEVYLPGVAEPAFTVGVERISERTANPDEISWTLIYHGGPAGPGEDIRNYTMRRDPAQPGRYVLDEHNGILLTNYMHGDDLLINDFEGLGFRLRGREEFRNGRYDFEFVTSEVTPEITSVFNGVEFYAYKVVSTQRCSMRRQRH
jgi:hypothetical protein